MRILRQNNTDIRPIKTPKSIIYDKKMFINFHTNYKKENICHQLLKSGHTFFPTFS